MKELIKIQSELKAPKNQYNSFGKYKYRSCEDILEALKPLLKENKCFLTISDEVVLVGNRIYVKATATISSADVKVENTAFAREPENQKGMNDAQITGSASSYARKYALNGLFCIDDTKDADVTNEHKKASDVKELEKAKIKINEYTSAMQLKDDMPKIIKEFVDKDCLEPDIRKIGMSKYKDLNGWKSTKN